MRRKDREWSENASAIITQRGRPRFMSILGECAPESTHGGEIVVRTHRTQLYGQAERCGEAIRIGKSRSTRDARNQARSDQIDIGSWRKFRTAARGGPLALFIMSAAILTESSDDEGQGRGDPREEEVP